MISKTGGNIHPGSPPQKNLKMNYEDNFKLQTFKISFNNISSLLLTNFIKKYLESFKLNNLSFYEKKLFYQFYSKFY